MTKNINLLLKSFKISVDEEKILTNVSHNHPRPPPSGCQASGEEERSCRSLLTSSWNLMYGRIRSCACDRSSSRKAEAFILVEAMSQNWIELIKAAMISGEWHYDGGLRYHSSGCWPRARWQVMVTRLCCSFSVSCVSFMAWCACESAVTFGKDMVTDE